MMKYIIVNIYITIRMVNRLGFIINNYIDLV